jgi:hypothetical protein
MPVYTALQPRRQPSSTPTLTSSWVSSVIFDFVLETYIRKADLHKGDSEILCWSRSEVLFVYVWKCIGRLPHSADWNILSQLRVCRTAVDPRRIAGQNVTCWYSLCTSNTGFYLPFFHCWFISHNRKLTYVVRYISFGNVFNNGAAG